MQRRIIVRFYVVLYWLCTIASFGEPNVKLAKHNNNVYWGDNLRNVVCSLDTRTNKLSVFPVTSTSICMGIQQVDLADDRIYVALKRSSFPFNNNIYKIYYASLDESIPTIEQAGNNSVSINPLYHYESVMNTLNQHENGVHEQFGIVIYRTTEVLKLNYGGFDMAVIDKNQIAVCQQSLDGSYVTIWLYSESPNSLSGISTKALRPFGDGIHSENKWYRYATCELNTIGKPYSLLCNNNELFLLSGNMLAMVTPDKVESKEHIYTGLYRVGQGAIKEFNKSYLGTPKKLKWTPIVHSETTGPVMIDKSEKAFSVMTSDQEVVTGSFSEVSLQTRKEDTVASTSLILKKVIQIQNDKKREAVQKQANR